MTARGTVKLVVASCRTVDDGCRVQAQLEKHGLRRGEDGVFLAEELAEVSDGFSIGPNTSRSSSLAWTATARSSLTFSMNEMLR